MVIMVAALSLPVASPALAGIATWASTVDLSSPGQNATEPQVTVAASGRATAVWTGFTGANLVIKSSTSLNGAAWIPAADLSAAGQDAYHPQVKVDSTGLAIAVWQRKNDLGKTVIQSSTSLNGGAWVPAPANLSRPGKDASDPQVTVDSFGLATAVWILSDGVNSLIQSSTSLKGATWTVPVDLPGSFGESDSPQVAVDASGLATAVWRSDVGGDFIVRSSTSLKGGAWTPTPPGLGLSYPFESSFAPQVSADSFGRTRAVWITNTFIGSGTNIVFSRSSVNGASWTAHTTISEVTQNASSPQVTVDPTGRATVVWTLANGINDVIQSSTSLNGAAWTTPVDVSAPLQNAATPQVTADSTGLVTAVWKRSNGTNDVIQSSTSLNGAAWIPASADLSATGGDAFAPQVSASSTGLVVAVWQRKDRSGNNIIQSSTAHVTSPVPSPAPPPATDPTLAATGTNATMISLMVGAGVLFLLLGLVVVGRSKAVDPSTAVAREPAQECARGMRRTPAKRVARRGHPRSAASE